MKYTNTMIHEESIELSTTMRRYKVKPKDRLTDFSLQTNISLLYFGLSSKIFNFLIPRLATIHYTATELYLQKKEKSLK